MTIENQDAITIVGGGIAGAATAYFLTQRGKRNIVILEKEKTTATGSSGRNAAILRTLIPDPLLRALARKSADFYRRPPAGFTSNPLINPVGVYLAARDVYAEGLLSCLDGSSDEDGLQKVPSTHLYSRIPALAPGLTTLLFQQDEGVFDVHEIIQSFLRGACRNGTQLRTACTATRLRVADGAVEGLETTEGFVPAKLVVMASGGWASRLAEAAGYPLPFTPHRRHLLVTQPLEQVDRNWPVVWIQGDEFYFRPESGGLLMCGCDAVPVTPEQGETLDPEEVEKIAAKAARWLPSLGDASVARAWAGMRTFASDQRFVIGPDPRLRGLFWVAGLGGHGITCAPAVGTMAAEVICQPQSVTAIAGALAPERLLR